MSHSPTTLLVMAAGMGSRFGGLKQITPVGPDGQVILDYSLYDAKRAGFDRVVFVIKKAIEKDFREVMGKRAEKLLDVDYVFQELDSLPAGFAVPEGRQKPYGTGHAVLCARDAVKTPFAVINADDFYGADAYQKLHAHLADGEGTGMVSFRLGNTLTENGTVSRGICKVENGYLQSVTEHTALDKNSGFPLDTPVSMNFWGFRPDFFDTLGSAFEAWFTGDHDPLKGEFFLPFVVDERIRAGKDRVRVMDTDGRWYGVTYREDLPTVQAAIRQLTEEGQYNGL
ncbi:MAG: NTP transferase domain-containing protein [Clostridia bacterium]|nr:NTP transferase domain-containing protein [Clostridia bacterium]